MQQHYVTLRHASCLIGRMGSSRLRSLVCRTGVVGVSARDCSQPFHRRACRRSTRYWQALATRHAVSGRRWRCHSHHALDTTLWLAQRVGNTQNEHDLAYSVRGICVRLVLAHRASCWTTCYSFVLAKLLVCIAHTLYNCNSWSIDRILTGTLDSPQRQKASAELRAQWRNRSS